MGRRDMHNGHCCFPAERAELLLFRFLSFPSMAVVTGVLQALAPAEAAAAGVFPAHCIQSGYAGARSFCKTGGITPPEFYWLNDIGQPSATPRIAYERHIAKINQLAIDQKSSMRYKAIEGQCTEYLLASFHESDTNINRGGRISAPCEYEIYTGGVFEGKSAPAWSSSKAYCPSRWSLGASEGDGSRGLPGFCYISIHPKNNGPTCGHGTNPINISTGNKFQVNTEYAPFAPGLTVQRYYNSVGNFPSIVVGNNWRLEYDRSIEFDSAGYALAHRHDGRIFMYKSAGSGWNADRDVNDRLQEVKEGNGDRAGWVYVTMAGEVERYDVNGRLQSITDGKTGTRLLEYSDSNTPGSVAPAAGLLIKVSDTNGRSLDLAYDGSSRLIAMKNLEGGITTSAYDVKGNLVLVSFPDGKTQRYHYENSLFTTALTGITDENGDRFATWAYDAFGDAILPASE